MIQAKFSYTEDGKTLILDVKGHAGQADKGFDIVCSAASILVNTLAQLVLYMAEDKQLSKKPRVQLDEGDSVITCKPKRKHYTEALHSFYVAEVGFNILSQAYPQYVDLQVFKG